MSQPPDLRGDKPAAGKARNRRISWLLGWLLALGLLAALYWSGRFDPHDLLNGTLDWGWLCLGLALFLPSYLLSAWRFQLTLSGLGVAWPFARAWRVTMYAALGELALPASFGADAIKALAAGRAADSGKLRGVAAAFVDRVIGLAGLVLFAAVACSLDRQTLQTHAQLSGLPALVVVLSAVSFAMVLTLLAVDHLMLASWRIRWRDHRWTGRIDRFVTMLADFCRSPASALGALLLAASGHLLWCLAAVALGHGLGLHTPLLPTLAVLPLVILANTVSFGGGIGGGVLVLDVLFEALFDVPRGLGCKLGLAIPMAINLSRLVLVILLSLADPSWLTWAEIWSDQHAISLRRDSAHVPPC